MSESVKLNFFTANYFDFEKGAESLNMLSASKNIVNMDFSLGLGIDTKYKLGSNQENPINNFALEAKAKYKINDNLNAQARFRKIGETEQYRVTFGGCYKFDKNNSIYSSAHLTTKNSNNKWSSNTGAWIGYTHKFNKFSLSAEYQQNIPFDRKIKPADSMINLILSVPI